MRYKKTIQVAISFSTILKLILILKFYLMGRRISTLGTEKWRFTVILAVEIYRKI
jgi:hypothetical protein